MQSVISLTKNAQGFVVWPKSNKANLHTSSDGNYHALKLNPSWIEELCRAGARETIHPSNVGDVLVFVGGSFLHGNPAGPSKTSREKTRLATYGRFE